MKMLSLLTLAAGAALIPAAALAQPGPRNGPPGVTWHGGGSTVVRHGGHVRPGPGFSHRIRRGFVVPSFWFGPQFHINNWQAYGFADPGADSRWIRYYDDAYRIDRAGRVLDSREGLDWDEYGERWEIEDGIPAYHGSNDYRPGEEDYAWAREQGGWGYGQYGPGYGPPPAQGGYYGYGGYGYGYAYPIIIETTYTPAVTYTEEIIEEVVEVRQRPRRRVHRAAAPRPRCDCPPRPAARPAPPPPRPAPRPVPRPAPPPAGERG